MRTVLSLCTLAICLTSGPAWGPLSSMIPEIYQYRPDVRGDFLPGETSARTEGCFASQWSRMPGLDWQNQLLLIENAYDDPARSALFIHRGTRSASLTQAGSARWVDGGIVLDVTSELSPGRVTRTTLEGRTIDLDGDGAIDQIKGEYAVTSCRWSSPTDCASPGRYLPGARGGWTAVRVPLELCLG